MTIKDIAKLAGVSTSTVSKVINHKDEFITNETRERIQNIIKEYNYTPYRNAILKSSPKSFTIGVLLNELMEFSDFIEGLLSAADEYRYSIILLKSDNDPEKEKKQIMTLCNRNIDGLIWEPVSIKSKDYTSNLISQKIPYCLVGNRGFDKAFQIDFEKIGYELTRKLLEKKHTNICCLVSDNKISKQIIPGFAECLRDFNTLYEEKMIFYFSDEDLAGKIVRNQITGIICSDYKEFLPIYKKLQELHYRIPEDISVVCVKSSRSAQCMYPELSGIIIPESRFAEYVCGYIVKQAEGISCEVENYKYTEQLQMDNDSSIIEPSHVRKKHIISVGSINLDTYFTVDEMPATDHNTIIYNSYVTVGGKGTNQAIGVAKLERESILLGCYGTDHDSEIVTNFLEKSKVSTVGVCRSDKYSTGKAYIYTTNSGESAITRLNGANQKLTGQFVIKNELLFKNSSYCLMSTELSMDAAIEAAALSKKYGVKSILKPSAIRELPQKLAVNIDIIVPNKHEAERLCPNYHFIEDIAEYFHSCGIPTVIITLAQEGCYLSTADQKKYISAADFITVDTTGGSDAFISALAVFLDEGYPIDKAAQIATFAAGFCISRQGVAQALVDRSTLENYIRSFSPDILSMAR